MTLSRKALQRFRLGAVVAEVFRVIVMLDAGTPVTFQASRPAAFVARAGDSTSEVEVAGARRTYWTDRSPSRATSRPRSSTLTRTGSSPAPRITPAVKELVARVLDERPAMLPVAVVRD